MLRGNPSRAKRCMKDECTGSLLQSDARRRSQQGEFIEDELLPQLRDDKDMNRLGREFLKAVERGNAPAVGAYIEEGFPPNYQDRQTQETALHISAAVKARKVLRVLLDCGLCNFLLRDKGGRLASELAYLFGQDPAAARLLAHQRAQAGGSARDQAHPAAENVPLKTAWCGPPASKYSTRCRIIGSYPAQMTSCRFSRSLREK